MQVVCDVSCVLSLSHVVSWVRRGTIVSLPDLASFLTLSYLNLSFRKSAVFRLTLKAPRKNASENVVC